MMVNFRGYQIEQFGDPPHAWVYRNGKRVMHFLLSSHLTEEELLYDMSQVFKILDI